MQDYGRFRVVDQKIQESQRLCIGLECRKAFGDICISPFIRREEIDPQPAFGNVTCDISPPNTRNGPERGINFFKNVENRKCLFTHGD